MASNPASTSTSTSNSNSNSSYPPRRNSSHLASDNNDGDLAQSLRQLSLSTSSATNSPRAPKSVSSPLTPAMSRTTPKSPLPKASPRTPLSGGASGPPNRPESRAGTPGLVRKASSNSLHSAAGTATHRAPSRRGSSVTLRSPNLPKSPLRSISPDLPERPLPTASSIARDHFQAELDFHHGPASTTHANTIVILHDNCYGHRYSRPRTSRAALSTIVERPERIQASAVGVSMAYVRLGERHMEGMYPLHPNLRASAISNVPFRIQKSSRKLPLMSPAVTNVHGAKWMEELKIMCETAESKLATNGKELARPDMNRGSDQDPPPKFHEGDLYLCAESLDAMEGALGAVCDAVDEVFKPSGPSRAFVAVRPPGHHCSASYPSGFCWLNNVHVGIMHAIMQHGLTHAAIIDFDLHHGDGSQAIAWDHNRRSHSSSKNASAWKKTSIGYFSLHDINSYPCEMGDEEKVKNASLCIENAHGQNIWNVHLQPWKSDTEFWELYESKYLVLLEKTRNYLKTMTEKYTSVNQPPKAAIFFSAGFDASEWEGSGMQRHNVNVPTDFYARIARDVTKLSAEEGTSVDGRVISVLEGGYSDRAISSGVFSHVCGLAGDDPMPRRNSVVHGLGFQMGQRLGLAEEGHGAEEDAASSQPYEPAWWVIQELEKMEADMLAPPMELKRPRHVTPPTYSSPTQASTAKIVGVPKIRRSVSGLMSVLGGASPTSRAPTPPPPDVPWTVAAHELSKLLIPTDRPTSSCKHEELNAEATRARRDRQSVLTQTLPGQEPAPAAPATTRMALRERKPARPVSAMGDIDEKSRRRTVAGSALTAEKAAARGVTPVPDGRPTRPARRLSAASSVLSVATERPAPVSSAANGIPRPDTSLTVRPESSMSVRSSAPLAVRKTRIATTKREPAARAPGRPRKTTAATGRAASSAVPPTPAAAETLHAGRPATAAGNHPDELDKITTGMKKIKINVITKEIREAREREAREKAEREKMAASVPRAQVSPAPSPPPPSQAFPELNHSNATSAPQEPGQPPAIMSPKLPVVQAPSQGQPLQPLADTTNVPWAAHQWNVPMLSPREPQRVPLPASSPLVRSPPPTIETSRPDMFIPYQPEGPSPTTIEPQQSLRWLPPNTSTPSPMKKTDLPVFTSTSAIPFAPRSEGTVKQVGKVDRSVWEIPETPQK